MYKTPESKKRTTIWKKKMVEIKEHVSCGRYSEVTSIALYELRNIELNRLARYSMKGRYQDTYCSFSVRVGYNI